jgi:hypothetical protein
MFQLRWDRWCAGIMLLAMAEGAQAQFVSFFDHARGTGTHQLTLVFPATTSGSTGNFTNVSTGVTVPITLTSTTSNNGALVNGAPAAGLPAPGTPAYNTFDSYVDFVGSPGASIQIPSNCFLVFTFSNLNPEARYSFRGSAVRGSDAYTNRWTKVTILDVDAATPNHTSNALTSVQAPADLGPSDAAFLFGQNHLPNQGDMAVWEDIDPGPDGVFQIVCTRYTGFVPNGGSSTAGSPPHGYGITGIRLEELSPGPVAITNGPTPSLLTVDQGETAQFTIAATGTGRRYEWFREDGQPILRAINTNTSVLTITNAQPADSAIYRVRVTNSVSSIISDPVSLTVNADTMPPALVSALGLVDGTNIVISFSEGLDAAASLSTNAFHVHLTAGGGVLSVANATVMDATNILVFTDAPRMSNQNYTVSIDSGAVSDANGVPFPGGEPGLLAQIYLLTFEGTEWRYNAEGVELAPQWYLADFDDSGWSNGFSVFDAKNPQPPGRPTVAGFAVATQLPLTNSLWPETNMVIPTYYFRTHFNLPTTPEHVTSLKLRTLIDDFDELFINVEEAHRSSGYPSTNPPPHFGYAGGTAVPTASLHGPMDIRTNILSEGDNVAAAILNQVSPNSSDITFGYELIATIDHFPEETIALSIGVDLANPGNLLITWPDPGAILYGRSQLDSGDWTAIDTTATPGQYSFNPDTADQRFFTLRRSP